MRHGLTRQIAAVLGTMAVAVVLSLPASAVAAPKPTDPQPYPWSRVAGGTTGDYFTDTYSGVGVGHVFEAATTDRLLDILSTNGTYYIALTGPEHASGQKVLGLLNSRAKAVGITKIYTWDPYLDGYQLNSVDASGWGTIQGSTSVNSSGTANVGEPWRLVKSLLPSSTVQPGGALYDYDGRGTLLLTVKITDRTDVQNGKRILASWSLEDTDAATFDPTSDAARAAIDAYLAPASNGNAVAPNSVRTQFEFFKRVYNASATAVETAVATASADRYGAPVQIFTDAEYPDGAGFRLQEITLQEYFDLVQSPGDKVFFFAGAGCHNTQAIIGTIAADAKVTGQQVYVVDLCLSSNVHFLTGANIDRADHATAIGGLWIRWSAPSVVATGAIYPRYGFSYLYGALESYLDSGLQTEYFSKQSDSIAYYPDGDFSAQETSDAPWIAGATNANAKKLQVPFLVRYNKDAPRPVTKQWLHTDSSSTATHTVYDEYMLDLANVREAPASVAATIPIRDGLTRTQFAREAVAALLPVITPKTVANTSVSISPSATTWTGAARTPSVNVAFLGEALALGTDYSVSYSSNVNVGLASVTITGLGEFSGVRTVTFAIGPKPSAIRRVLPSVGQIKVTFTRVAQITGYQLEYRLRGTLSWKLATVGSSKTAAVLSILRARSSYQVRIRTYKRVDGVAYASAWSATKTSKAAK